MTATEQKPGIGAVIDGLGLWPARISWGLLPILVGPALKDGLDGLNHATQLTAEILLWFGWFAGLVSLLAPSTVSLTVLRILAPFPLIVSLLTLFRGSESVSALAALAAGVGSTLALGMAFLPLTGDEMVNGSAYGAERRLALRPPASLLLGPILLTWSLLAASTIAGPLLLASGYWFVGLPTIAFAILIGVRGGKSLHLLARRWIVFTPAGFVIHDYFLLAESLLLQRKNIEALGPAPAEPRGTMDLSAGALGLALQVESKDAIEVAVRNGREVVVTNTVRIIFSPSLPGRLLREARVRGIRVN